MGMISKYRNKYQTGGLQHLLAQQVRQEVGVDVFDEYFKFSFVRNPWDKAVSQFLFMRKIPFLRKYIGMSKNAEFKKYLSLIQQKKHVQWEPQSAFLENENGEILVDFIGRFENYENDVRSLLLQLQISGIDEIPHRKRASRAHYRDYYDAESEEMVRDIYQQDIVKFNYEF